jgi:nitrite reductase/ring-hydroxylating ferredoxin subunit/uncharacterized membrane protein
VIFQQGIDILARRGELDAPSRWLQAIIRRTYKQAGARGERVENALYGTEIGHPLHPALTDVAIGAWTAAFVFDLLDGLSQRRAFARCADGAVAIGLFGGVASVFSGLTDWQHTASQPRRIGLVHGLGNISAVLLQTASLALRALGARDTGRALSGLAYGTILVTAYLGGELVEKYRIGVNRAPVEAVPERFVPVMAEPDLPENELRQVDVDGTPVLLVRRGERIYAMHATCTHLGGPLAQGAIVDGGVQCPWHGSRFALSDGHVVRGPASFPERCLATRVRNGQIEVGPGAGLGRCRHEAVPAPAREMAGRAAARAY